MNRVVVVGAGISGLALACRLQQAAPSAEVTVLERQGRPGGTVWTEEHGGFRLETGPNGFLDTKPSTLALCRDLGLGDRLVAASEAAGRNRYLFLDGELRPLPNSFGSFLRSDLLSWRGKVALLAERFRRPRRDAADESVAAFARRRAGREVAEVFADALVTGIHAGDPELLSIRAAFPRLSDLEDRYGSVLRGVAATARQRRKEAAGRGEVYRRPGQMWSFADGLRLLIEALRDRLARPPLLGAAVRRIQKVDPAGAGGWVVQGDGPDRRPADAVVLACPAPHQAAILADLDPDLAERIGGIAYNRIAVVGIGFRRGDVPVNMNGFGYIAPQRTRQDVLGVQWCSSIFPARAPDEAVLLRAMCGGWHRAEVAGWDDPRLLAAVRADLRQAMGITAEPVFHRIIRWDRAIPQYHLGHAERVAWIEKRAALHPGLFLTGNAYHGVSLNDCTEQAEVFAGQVARYLASSAAPG
jgi:oxygen-dependent protoporphyrinogen oxidase